MDFWKWALSDLRMNTVRGFLVEYIVATAVKSEAPFRREWAPFDVLSADGTRIEVKASGYLQSWSQSAQSAAESVPSYSFKTVNASSVWNDELAVTQPVDPADRVDVWVFALQICKDHELYNPLAINQWRFRVIPHPELLASGQTSARLSFFDRRNIEPVEWDDLPDAVKKAQGRNKELPPP